MGFDLHPARKPKHDPVLAVYRHAVVTSSISFASSHAPKQVFVLQFAIGEFDMVVFDPASSSCKIYEIKHSAEIVSEQTRHLIDEEKCRATEHRFGPIKGKYVIYRGPAKMVGEVQYLNVEECLCERRLGR